MQAAASWSFDATEARVRRLAGSFLAGRSFYLALDKDSKVYSGLSPTSPTPFDLIPP